MRAAVNIRKEQKAAVQYIAAVRELINDSDDYRWFQWHPWWDLWRNWVWERRIWGWDVVSITQGLEAKPGQYTGICKSLVAKCIECWCDLYHFAGRGCLDGSSPDCTRTVVVYKATAPYQSVSIASIRLASFKSQISLEMICSSKKKHIGQIFYIPKWNWKK